MENLVLLCLGTTRITGDSLGPRVGDILKAKNVGAYVYGTSTNCVTSLNIDQYRTLIETQHRGALVVVVDATLGHFGELGKIKLNENGIKPGGAFHDERKRLGDIGIMTIVGDSDSDRMTELKTRDDNFVQMLAEKTAKIIVDAIF